MAAEQEQEGADRQRQQGADDVGLVPVHLTGGQVGLEHERPAVGVGGTGVDLEQLALAALAGVLGLVQPRQLRRDGACPEQPLNVSAQWIALADDRGLVGPEDGPVRGPHLHVPDAAVAHPVLQHQPELPEGLRSAGTHLPVDEGGSDGLRDGGASQAGFPHGLVARKVVADDHRAKAERQAHEQAPGHITEQRAAHHGPRFDRPGHWTWGVRQRGWLVRCFRAVTCPGAHRAVLAGPRSRPPPAGNVRPASSEAS